MSFAPARPRWPWSALHSLASSTQCNGPCLQTSISPCLLTSKPTVIKQICTNSSYNINKQKAFSNNPRHLGGKTDRLPSDRDSSKKQKYPWRGEEEKSEKLPWQKERLPPKKHNGPYSLKKTSRDKKKTDTLKDKQNMEFNSSRGRLSFGNGPIMPTAPWMQGWSNVPIKDLKKNAGKNKVDLDSDNDDLGQIQHFDGSKRKTAMHRIVDRLRNLDNFEEIRHRDRDDSNSSSPEGTHLAEKKIMPSNNIGTLLENKWGDMDQGIEENGKGSVNIPLPWERNNASAKSAKEDREKRVKAPTLAELTIPDTELKRLRTLGIRVKERINVPKAGLTQNVLDKIHDQWRTSELVRLKFDEPLSENMKRAHQLSEDKTGGFVIWRAGSALVLYRGSNYEPPFVRAARAQARISSGVGILVADNKPFVPDTKLPDPVTRRKRSNVLDGDASSRLLDPRNAGNAQPGHEIISNEVQLFPSTGKLDPEKEINTILDGLGPRFIDWWGHDPLPVDADLLPEVVPNYKTPFRLLPYGTKRSKLSNSEMTNLRKLARPLPIHFALGRNRRLQGLAAAIVKLWERSEIAKIAVKRGFKIPIIN